MAKEEEEVVMLVIKGRGGSREGGGGENRRGERRKGGGGGELDRRWRRKHCRRGRYRRRKDSDGARGSFTFTQKPLLNSF